MKYPKRIIPYLSSQTSKKFWEIDKIKYFKQPIDSCKLAVIVTKFASKDLWEIIMVLIWKRKKIHVI